MDDAELLREFVDDQSETAFAGLVLRHVNLVYSTALRMVRDPGLAVSASVIGMAVAANAIQAAPAGLASGVTAASLAHVGTASSGTLAFLKALFAMKEAEVTGRNVCDRPVGGEANPMVPASVLPAEAVSGAPVSTTVLSTFCWSVAAILLSFFCVTHLGVMLCLGVGSSVSPVVAPAALLLSLAIGGWVARREGLRGLWRIGPSAIVLALVAVASLLATFFFDFGWDGQWYHQTAVYQMAHGWNPLQDPMHEFVPRDVEPMLRHFPKGPWFIALALFETTGNIEWAKAGTWLALATMFFAVFAAGLDFGIRPRIALVVAMLVSLNPVVVCESASYLVDGLLVSFLTCFVAALFRWFRGSSRLVLIALLASAALCINTKLSGLVYLCFACTAGGLYALMKRRDLLLRYAAIQIAAVLLGAVVFGFNPYVTNTVHRGNPFYPVLGTAAHPGMSQGTDNPIDRYDTPKNLLGRSPIVRLGYAVFGRPGVQPLYGGDNAQLMWPFDVGWKDFNLFRVHGVRISGFGPLFSGAFLISLILLGVTWVRSAVPREVLLLFAGAIIASLLISKHTWWARLGPQLWWLPIIAVIAGLCMPCWRAVRWTAWGLAALLLVNATLIGFAHMQWEIEASRTLRDQLAFLRNQESVKVNLRYFGVSFGERLRTAGVRFEEARPLSCPRPMDIMSVAPGYPGVIRACIHRPTDHSSPPQL